LPEYSHGVFVRRRSALQTSVRDMAHRHGSRRALYVGFRNITTILLGALCETVDYSVDCLYGLMPYVYLVHQREWNNFLSNHMERGRIALRSHGAIECSGYVDYRAWGGGAHERESYYCGLL